MTRAARVAALALALHGAARADTPRDTPAAMDVDRDDAPPGRVEFGFESGAPVDAWGASVAAGLLDRPIVLASGAPTYPVRRRETLALGGALAIGESVVVDARLAAAHQVGDRLAALGDATRLARAVLDDLRVGARLRVAGGAGRAAFLRAELTLPTGNGGNFAGEARWTAAWSLVGRAALPAGIVIAGTAGIRLRGAEVRIGDRVVGDEVFGAAGIAVPLPPVRPLWCVADAVKLTAEVLAIAGDNVAGKRGPSPAEARLGIVTRPLPALTVGVRAGLGLDDQIGAPRFRALVELAWTPPAAPRPPAPAPVAPPEPEPDED